MAKLTLEALEQLSKNVPKPLLDTPNTIWDLLTITPDTLPAHLGITSRTVSGNHIIMWDFDDKTLDQVVKAVKTHHNFETIPAAYIVQSNIDARHFHVYVFTEGELSSGHKQADSKHNSHSKQLGFRTLRITPKDGFAPKVVKIIKGSVTATETPLTELTTLAVYPMNQPGIPYNTTPVTGRLEVATYDLMQAVKFLQQLETAQKTKELPQ